MKRNSFVRFYVFVVLINLILAGLGFVEEKAVQILVLLNIGFLIRLSLLKCKNCGRGIKGIVVMTNRCEHCKDFYFEDE